jgi:hypothetical protein
MGGIDRTSHDSPHKDVQYLICWIPSQLLKMVDDAIQSDPTECIDWLDKTPLPLSFLGTLKEAGFLD